MLVDVVVHFPCDCEMVLPLAARSDDAVSLVHAGQQFLRLFIGNVVERGMCDNSLDVGRTFFGLSFDSLLLLDLQ